MQSKKSKCCPNKCGGSIYRKQRTCREAVTVSKSYFRKTFKEIKISRLQIGLVQTFQGDNKTRWFREQVRGNQFIEINSVEGGIILFEFWNIEEEKYTLIRFRKFSYKSAVQPLVRFSVKVYCGFLGKKVIGTIFSMVHLKMI